MFCRVIYVYRQNDRKTKNDRIYTINKDFNVAQIRYKLCRTTCDTTANSTVSNEQQAVRGISVITPLPTGEGMGEGPACAFIFIDRMTEWGNLLYLLGVLNSSMAGKLLAEQRGGDYHIYLEHIRNQPIPLTTPKQQEEIAQLVRSIMNKIQAGKTVKRNNKKSVR